MITNGHWHSHGHFMLQGVRLFWPCIYATCATRLHLLKTIDPAINNLEKNAYMHYTNFIFTVHVASIAFIVNHVTEPPPELFLSNPVCRLGCHLPPHTHHHNTGPPSQLLHHSTQHSTLHVLQSCYAWSGIRIDRFLLMCRSFTVLVSITPLALTIVRSRPCATLGCLPSSFYSA